MLLRLSFKHNPTITVLLSYYFKNLSKFFDVQSDGKKILYDIIYETGGQLHYVIIKMKEKTNKSIIYTCRCHTFEFF